MDLPPNFVGMSERQQLRYLSEQAEAANKPPEPVAAGSPFEPVSTGVTRFLPCRTRQKEEAQEAASGFRSGVNPRQARLSGHGTPVHPLQSAASCFCDESLLRCALSVTCRPQ